MVDPRIIAYVREQRQAGYDDAKIRVALQTSGYPSSFIDSAFASASNNSVADSTLLRQYVASYLAQGYNSTSIRSSLLEQGYTQKDVERALNEASLTPSVKRISSNDSLARKSVLAIFPLLALALLVGGYFFVENLYSQGSSPPIVLPTNVSFNSISDEFIPLASQNATQARELCDRVAVQDKSRCILEVSRASSDPRLCKEILVPRLADACYLEFIYNGHLQYCEFLALEANIAYCTSAKLFEQQETGV